MQAHAPATDGSGYTHAYAYVHDNVDVREEKKPKSHWTRFVSLPPAQARLGDLLSHGGFESREDRDSWWLSVTSRLMTVALEAAGTVSLAIIAERRLSERSPAIIAGRRLPRCLPRHTVPQGTTAMRAATMPLRSRTAATDDHIGRSPSFTRWPPRARLPASTPPLKRPGPGFSASNLDS